MDDTGLLGAKPASTSMDNVSKLSQQDIFPFSNLFKYRCLSTGSSISPPPAQILCKQPSNLANLWPLQHRLTTRQQSEATVSARGGTIENIEGSEREQYAQLRDYMKQLLLSNPSTTLDLDVTQVPDSTPLSGDCTFHLRRVRKALFKVVDLSLD
ncbi:hypothetical protein PIB30_012406 [Stylosanthes scabra]|uniref:Uncharacterized protein n=1 Tax=Stylosanthes scabra TaxID=79078 RepID=A0ABU6R505_9FABA|nr:hypothetical protein [Stylosanthes scabra]